MLLLQCKVTEQTNKSQPSGGVAHLGCKIPPVRGLELHLLQSGVQQRAERSDLNLLRLCPPKDDSCA